ncbi:MAG: hypothetical protein ACRD0D_10200 [Acidimicrobiales bacterium]
MGAAACLACCAGPILALLGALGVASTLFMGVAGLAIAALGAVAVIVLRRRRRKRCAAEARVALAAPARRTAP